MYGLGSDQILRALHDSEGGASLRERAALVDELRRSDLGFALPEVVDTGVMAGRSFAIERRLPGRAVSDLLPSLNVADRAELIEAHLDTASELHKLPLDPRPWFGEILADPPVRHETWSGFLRGRARYSLAEAPAAFADIDPDRLADELPECDVKAFVHLDAFVGNMLAVDSSITAVIDIGLTSLVGDPYLDSVAAVVYFCAPAITPVATAADRDIAVSWLRNRGLNDRYEPTRRWLAAYWSWAVKDADLHTWCRDVLLSPP